MASGQRPDQRVVHQDYIARVRYSNALPPPTCAPKLLDIPGTGLAGGQYTSAAYAARLAKEQPLNIEADAELGMPIDLVGIPGIFDGDESAIMARPGTQTLDPKDKALLKPLSTLGKGAGVGGVTFLRRTEYVAAQGPQHYAGGMSKDPLRRNDPKRRKTSTNKEEPLNIMRNIVKGFDLAYPHDKFRGEETSEGLGLKGATIIDAEVKAWANPKHPSKSDVELLDSYPVLPDLEALPSAGWFMVTKFITNPAGGSKTYDERLDAAILRPKDNPQAAENFNQRLAEWDEHSGKPQPMLEDDYDYFLPLETSAVRGIKRKLDVNDPDNEDEDLYTDDIGNGQRAFKYTRLRTYETYSHLGDARNFYDDSLALALHDPETEVGVVPGAKQRLAKGAYFYPVQQRAALRPKRNVGAMALSQVRDENQADEINLSIADLADSAKEDILDLQATLDPSIAVDTAPEVEATA